MPLPQVDIVLIALASPIQVGIYQQNRLIDSEKYAEKTSDILPLIFKNLLQQYAIKTVYFARGPGSFMSIKLVYVFLKTLQLSHGLTLRATDGFTFSDGLPIKAVGNTFFVKDGDTIAITDVPPQDGRHTEFHLPERLDATLFSDDIQPLYLLPAV